MIMADNLCGLLDFWAIVCFGRFLANNRRRDAVLFGLFACLSVLTKGNGIALALVPPAGVLITRRFDLLKRLNFWIPAAMVLAIAGPWQYVSSRLLSGILTRTVSWQIAAAYAPMFVSILGPWLLPVVFVGIYDRLVVPFRRRAVQGIWAAAGALMAAFWVFHALVPSAGAEERYMIAVVGPMLMFFTAGLAKLAALMPARVSYRMRAGALAVLSVAIFTGTSFGIPQKQSYGFSEVAQYIMSRPDAHESVMLISSEAFGEGIMIAEIAMRDQRPGLFVLRANKLLARLNWAGEQYELLYRTPEETLACLREIPVRFLVLDKTPALKPLPHHRNLVKMVAMYPDRWQLLGVYPQKIPVTSAVSRIEVYRLIGDENRPRGKIRLDLRYSLGRFIEK
jgi:MFS family permease